MESEDALANFVIKHWHPIQVELPWLYRGAHFDPRWYLKSDEETKRW